MCRVYRVQSTHTQCCAPQTHFHTFSHAFPFPKQVYQVRSMLPRNALCIPVCPSVQTIIAIISLFASIHIYIVAPWWDMCAQQQPIAWNSCRKWVYPYYIMCIEAPRSTQFVREYVWFGLVWFDLCLILYRLAWFGLVWIGFVWPGAALTLSIYKYTFSIVCPL